MSITATPELTFTIAAWHLGKDACSRVASLEDGTDDMDSIMNAMAFDTGLDSILLAMKEYITPMTYSKRLISAGVEQHLHSSKQTMGQALTAVHADREKTIKYMRDNGVGGAESI